MMRRAITLLVLAAVAVPVIGLAQGRRGAPAPAAPVTINTEGLLRDSAGNVILRREVYTYPSAGRRDPFASLIASGDIRPLLSDLVIVAISLDPTGRNSVATLKDASTNELYRVRNGSVFGRMRVTAIRQREVGLAIDEFGYTRQETLSITVPTRGGRTP